MISVERYHDISCGHRVVKHESKCRHLHGHNYRIHFRLESTELDSLGRVLDFSLIKDILCQWLEENWDHRMLIYLKDPLLEPLLELDRDSIVVVPFNPTAENIALYLLEVIGPELLKNQACRLTECRVEETRKCSATASIK